MKHFPGRTIDEILALATDISETARLCRSPATDTVYELLAPAARSAIDNGADRNEDCGAGYSLGAMLACGYRIAEQLDRLGYVDIS